MKVLIASKNKEKIEAVKQAFEMYFDNVEIEAVDVSSDVSKQPINEEIYEGLKNRINNLKQYARKNNIEADFYTASEAGLTNQLGEWVNINAVMIEDKNEARSFATSSAFPIPDRYIEEIKQSDLKTVLTNLFNENEYYKQNGAVKSLTKNKITRVELNRDAFIMALTKYINGEVWI